MTILSFKWTTLLEFEMEIQSIPCEHRDILWLVPHISMLIKVKSKDVLYYDLYLCTIKQQEPLTSQIWSVYSSFRQGLQPCTHCPTGYQRCLVVWNILLSSSMVGACWFCRTSLLRWAFRTWSWVSAGLVRASGRGMGCRVGPQTFKVETFWGGHNMRHRRLLQF